ncbi:MAG: hypothetical protein MJB14_21380 [Spirochaetes bacterium]|nr:hypothetical protein [Spirochaetota bacterium]
MNIEIGKLDIMDQEVKENKEVERKQLIEKLFLNEAINSFILRNNRDDHILKDASVLKHWYNFSAQFIQTWLSYMTDEQIENMLSEKLKKYNDNAII